jgi:hypothetical protein
MKGLKIFAFVVGGILVFVAIGIGLALTPSVQTWAVRKAVAKQPGMTIEVSRVAAGPSAADITDLRYVKDGMVVTAKGVSARYSAWDYVSKKRINADSVTIEDLVIDLRNVKPSPSAPGSPSAGTPPTTASGSPSAPASPRPASAEKKTPFDGLLKQAQLPFDVRVATVVARGRALLPNNQIVTFDLKGSNIETGQRGKLEWTIDFADSTAGAALRALRATGNAAVHITIDRRIDVVEVETIAAAMGPKLAGEQIKLAAKAEKPTATADENYSVNVSLVRGTTVEPLLKSTAQFLAASHEITGSWDLALRTEQLAGLLTGLGLPELAANGAGKFTFNPDTNAVSASGDLQAQTAQLQKFMPALAAIGTVQFKSSFDGSMAGDLARLEKLNLEVSGTDGRKFAQVSSLQKVTYSLTDKRVTLVDPKAELARISLQALPLAWAQAFAKPMMIDSGDLSMVLAVEAEPDGSRVRARAVEPLVIRSVTVRQGDKKLVDQVTLTTKPTVDYSATKIVAQLTELSVTMPAGDSLAGNLSAEVTNFAKTPVIAFVAQIQAKVVEALKPYLPVPTGPLAIAANIEGRHEGQILQLTKNTITVNRDASVLLSSLELQQPIRADLKAMTFTVANPNATAARMRLGEIPLAWAEPFVAKSKLAGSLTGATMDVTMRSIDDLTITTAEPIMLRGVTASMDGKAMAQGLDLSANFAATKRGDTIAYEVRKVEVKQGQALLAAMSVTGEAKLGTKMTVVAKGNFEADAAAMMTQPVLAPFATLSRGRIAAAFDANMAEAIQAKAVISAKNLVAKQDNRALGDLELSLTANVKPDASGTISMPLTLTNAGRKSDVTVDGTFGKAANKETFLFTGKIGSNQLVVDDFQPLAALAPAGEKPKTPTAPKTTRDTEPFWKGVNGKVELDLKRVLYGKDYVISPVRGTAVITDSKISLDGLEGRFKENPFKVSGGVTFAAQQPKPYSLTASADVQNFDVGAFLRAANPNEKPALETKATLSAKLNGTGGTVGDLGKNAFGKFELTGTKGTMYLLERKGGAGTAVNALAAGLSILGAARGSDTASALAEIAKLLNAVQFDSVKMQIERGADLSFKLTSMEVLSPILRMTGSGTVASKSADDIQNAPMNIVLQLGAKEQLGYLLQRVRMLGQNQDDKGYQLMSRTFSVGGTPSKPDSGALWKILGEAAAGAFLR